MNEEKPKDRYFYEAFKVKKECHEQNHTIGFYENLKDAVPEDHPAHKFFVESIETPICLTCSRRIIQKLSRVFENSKEDFELLLLEYEEMIQELCRQAFGKGYLKCMEEVNKGFWCKTKEELDKRFLDWWEKEVRAKMVFK